MKKKTIALLLTVALAITTFGCGKADKTQDTEDTTLTEASVNTELPVEPVSEIPTEEPAAFDSTGYTQFGNVYYILSADWEFFQDTSGTLVYRFPDGSESFAIYVQNETDYTAQQMYDSYNSTILSTYGDRGTQEELTLGSLTWHVYHYTGDNDLNAASATDVYVYSDGTTTIYAENAFAAGAAASGKFQELLASVVIQ